jgi:anti-anti-sigma factor
VVEIRFVSTADTEGVTITVSGSCELTDARHLHEVVEEVLDSGFRAVTLELSEVTYLSEHCLASLIGAGRSAKGYGIEISLRDPSPTCRRKLELTGVQRMSAKHLQPTTRLLGP